MNINWKLRIQNKTTLTAIVATTVALFYQIAGMAGIVPPVSESQVVNLVGTAINLLAVLGILVDPTTAGISDSTQAMYYDEPRKS